jgi:hypothetical protein
MPGRNEGDHGYIRLELDPSLLCWLLLVGEGPPTWTVIVMRCLGFVLLPVVFLIWLGKGACRAADSYSVPPSDLTSAAQPERQLRSDDELLPEEIELSRFKKQALQSVSVAAGGVFELDDRQLNSSFLDLGIGTGIPMGSFDNILGVTPRFRVDWIESAPQIDIPEQLYEFELQFFYRRTIRDRLSLLAIVSPAIRSDLSTSDEAFRLFSLGLLNWECIPDRLTLSAGAVVLGRADLPVLPALGVVWTPNPRTKLDLRFPLTRLSSRVSKHGGESETWVYLAGGIGGNTWAVTRATDEVDELSLRDYRLTAGWERLVNGGGGCFAELGLALGRRLEYERSNSTLSFDDAALISAGWRY